MRLTCLLIVAFLLNLAVPPTLHAQDQGVSASPYSVTVPVTDTSPEQRNQAFSTALAQVLTRVAGGQDLRNNPNYGSALESASSLVQQFQYQKAGEGFALQVNFAPASVRRLVATLGVTPAGVKPPVLLLVRGADGKLFDESALAPLASAAAARGTEFAYPDGAGLPAASRISAADPAALAAIDQHYHTGLILLGTVNQDKADWTLVSGGQVQHWQSLGTTEDAVLKDGGQGLADRLSRQLNVIGAGSSQGTVWVSGLHSAEDYANLLATLRANPSVQDVRTAGAKDDGVLLDVRSSVPLNALSTSLAAGGRLLQAEPHQSADASLRWLH